MATPIPTTLDADDLQCASDCAAGTCQEPPERMVHSLSATLDFFQNQAIKAGQANQPCKPCDGKKELANFVTAHKKGGGKAAGTFNFAAIIQMLLPVLLALLQSLFPPTPTPAPTP